MLGLLLRSGNGLGQNSLRSEKSQEINNDLDKHIQAKTNDKRVCNMLVPLSRETKLNM